MLIKLTEVQESLALDLGQQELTQVKQAGIEKCAIHSTQANVAYNAQGKRGELALAEWFGVELAGGSGQPDLWVEGFGVDVKTVSIKSNARRAILNVSPAGDSELWKARHEGWIFGFVGEHPSGLLEPLGWIPASELLTPNYWEATFYGNPEHQPCWSPNWHDLYRFQDLIPWVYGKRELKTLFEWERK